VYVAYDGEPIVTRHFAQESACHNKNPAQALLTTNNDRGNNPHESLLIDAYWAIQRMSAGALCPTRSRKTPYTG